MKGFWICLFVYTLTIFWFGMWVQRASDQRQLKAFEIEAFSDGCHKCTEFAKLDCQRDQLQGQEGFTQIP